MIVRNQLHNCPVAQSTQSIYIQFLHATWYCLQQPSTVIRNPRAVLITFLFVPPNTLSSYDAALFLNSAKIMHTHTHAQEQ